MDEAAISKSEEGIQLMMDAAVLAIRKKVPETQVQDESCKGCQDEIEPERQKMGYDRCYECARIAELRQKQFAR